MANVAASELDRSLERLGVGFVRYADDTLIWSSDYGRISAAADALHEASEQIGSAINAEKSPGIRLLVKNQMKKAEMASTSSVHYLGHELELRGTRMKPASVLRIKDRISNLIYSNLLLEPLRKAQSHERLSNFDKDYVTLMWQIRRYLYGSLSENQVRRFQTGSVPPMSFEGVMSFYPLIDDEASLLELDQWMTTQIWLTLKKRKRLLVSASLPAPKPMGLNQRDLIGFQTFSSRTGDPIDLRMPSFRRIATVIRRAVSTHGLGVVAGDAPLYVYE